MEKLEDKIWYEEPGILLNKNRLIEFFPSSEHSLYEKYNAIVRLTLYITVLLTIYHNDFKYMSILILVLLITFYLYKFDRDNPVVLENLTETETKNEIPKCYKPTLNNPFMNVNFTEYDENGTIQREPACDTEEVKKQTDEYFHNNLYRDTSDLFGKMNSQRQFFTMPYTTVPNDPNGDFKNWLYKSPKTCKEDQDYCTGRNEDVRRNFRRN